MLCQSTGFFLPEILETFTRWGVATCGRLAALPVIQLSERMGQEGVRLHLLARGALVRSLVLAKPSIFFQEEMELDDSVEELESLSFVLGRLLDQLCERLAARSLSARSIRMEFDLERSFEKGLQLSTHAGQHKLLPRKFEKTLALPVPMRDSKLLLKLVRLRLQSDPPPAAVIKIVILAEADRVRTTQRGLFLPASPEPEKLELTMARLANLVGDGNVGSPQLIDTHRPDAIRMERFRVAQEAAAVAEKRNALPQQQIRIFLRREWPSLPMDFVFYAPAFRRAWNCAMVFRREFFFKARAEKSWPLLDRGELQESGGRTRGIKRNGMWKCVFHRPQKNKRSQFLFKFVFNSWQRAWAVPDLLRFAGAGWFLSGMYD